MMKYQLFDDVHYMFGRKVHRARIVGIKTIHEVMYDNPAFAPRITTEYRYSVRDLDTGMYRFDCEAANFEEAAAKIAEAKS